MAYALSFNGRHANKRCKQCQSWATYKCYNQPFNSKELFNFGVYCNAHFKPILERVSIIREENIIRISDQIFLKEARV